MNFSASELVKRSASQLLFKELKKLQWQATKRQVGGNVYADELVSLNKASGEKRGVIEIGSHLLFFCIDLVKNNLFAEVKMIESPYEDWFLQQSVLQATFYSTLLGEVRSLDTPKFRKKEGYSQEVLKVPEEREYQLWFGKEKYRVFPNEEVRDHYIEKLNLISDSIEHKDFDTCRDFDECYKHKEFTIFKPKYLKLKP